MVDAVLCHVKIDSRAQAWRHESLNARLDFRPLHPSSIPLSLDGCADALVQAFGGETAQRLINIIG